MSAVKPASPEQPTFPDQVYRDGSSVGYSDFHREYGFVKVTVSFLKDNFQTVSIELFDLLGQPKGSGSEHPPLESALGLHGRLRSLGPSRIRELDAVSGATITVNAIKQATERASEKARYRTESDAAYYDGTFLGVSDRSLRGWTIAIVTVHKGVLEHVMLQGIFPLTKEQEDGTQIEVEDEEGNFIYQAATPEYPWREYHTAIDTLESEFVAAGISGVEYVDAVTRATVTSVEAKTAVLRALEAAKR